MIECMLEWNNFMFDSSEEVVVEEIPEQLKKEVEQRRQELVGKFL